MQAVSRDEFEIAKQLLTSAARYAESASRQTADNATQIADNAEGIQELKLIQAENAIQIEWNTEGIAALAERQDRFQTQLAKTRNLVDSNAPSSTSFCVS